MDLWNIAKVAGSIATALAFVSGLTYSLVTIINDVKFTKTEQVDIKATLHRLETNHLAHIQDSLNKQDVEMTAIKQATKAVETRLADHVVRFEDTKKSVDRINDAVFAAALKKISSD